MRSDTVPTVNTARFDKLVTLLKELFQLDRPDLDFGFFRIMHAKSAEVTRFLERDLLPQVQTAFSEYGSGDRKRLKEEYRSAVEQAEKLGAPDPETLPGVRDAKRRLAEAGESTDSLEADVYDHLYRFFRRYYSEGDFLSRRVYKPGVYAVPYEGEEVKLHWANADQYYIKTDEYLRNYAFKLRPDDDADPMRVHFRLADAAEAEHGNIKSSAVRKRVFVLCSGDFIGEEEGELVIRFEYRPASPDDGASNGKKKPPKQKDLVDLAESKVMQQLEGRDRFARWARALSEHHVLADGSKADYTCLRAHLNRYTARNTYDYFIHKDLGAFLRRELDFYIKNEVIHLDDIESESAPRVAQYLSKIRVIRRIAHKIIDFLAQLEGFQKRLWLKKKFVVDASWCVRIGCIPEEFHAEITANEAQREEWVKLCAINEIESDLAAPGYTVPLTSRFLKAHSTLMLDTKHFSADFTARLLSTIDNLDDAMDGVLVHSENFQALSLMQARYRGRVYCIYIDPPYNTGNDGFVYRDNYQHSSWAAMAAQGLPLAKRLGTRSSAIFASIDDAEQPMLRFLLDEAWGPANHVADMCWAAGRKNDSRFVSVSHDYILVYATDLEHLRESKAKWWQRKRGLDDIYLQHRRLIRKHKTDYGTITNNLKKWFRDLPDSHPAKAHRHYSHVDRRGVYFPDNISWPGGAGPKYEVLHPVTKKPVRVPAAGWRFSKPETMQQHIEEDRIHFGADETKVPCRKSYLTDHEYESPYSVFYRDGRAATNRLRNVLGSADFGYPKDDTIIAECVGMVTSEEGTVLDYFAGSGTTGHAVINLNRDDGGRRKFVLVEMGAHFDTVLLPRLKKITYSPEWKAGKPKRRATPDEAERSPRIFKVVRLESYEDTLNNLAESGRTALSLPAASGSDRFREQYLLHYMLDVETRGSASLLDIGRFTDPANYRLKIKVPGSDESRDVAVDLIETFNWLLGLRVERMQAPQVYHASFRRDGEGRLRLDGALEACSEDGWSFRAVEGLLPDGRRALVIWRNRPGKDDPAGLEEDNLVLNEWFKARRWTEDRRYDAVYVNGDNNLANLGGDAAWQAYMIEGHFRRLMFDIGDTP